MFVWQIMSQRPVTVTLDDRVADAQRLLKRYGIHHLLVVDDRQLIGVVTDRDLLKHVSPFIDKLTERPQDVATLQRRVHQVMTRRPVTVGPDVTAREAAQWMWAHALSCLPVVDAENRPIGIVTRSDMLLSVCVHPEPVDEDTASLP